MKKKYGFTMVEIIIVVAIIAVLASIIIPRMGGARDRANLAACESNLRLIGVALEMYSNDNQSCYPPASGGVKINTSCILYTGGYLTKITKCPVINPNDYAYWWYSSEPYTRVQVYAPWGFHTPLGIPNNYPRYDSARGVVER